MTVRKTATFQVRPEGLDRAKAAIRRFVAYVRENEPGTLRYLSLQERDDPTRFLHYFEFRDEKAEDIHSSSQAVQRFTSVLYPLCVRPVEFTDLALLATTESQPS
jgi:quinol monooxygenase YgiN